MAQTTGKISGTIKDDDTKEPLIAANVIVKNTNLGAASDIEGYYSIVNIKPGAVSYTHLTLPTKA